MIDEIGTVVEARDEELAVRIDVAGSCGSCPIKDYCYGNERVVWMPKKEAIRVGEQVRFSVSNFSVLKISALVYGIPLISLIAGIVIGYLVFFRSLADDPKILLAVFTGAVFFALAAYAVSRLDKTQKNRLLYSVVRLEHSSRYSQKDDFSK